MSKSIMEMDTYYAVEWRSKKSPHEGWRWSTDSYGNIRRRDTPEEARAAIREKEATLSVLGFGGTKEFRVVKVTITKEAVE